MAPSTQDPITKDLDDLRQKARGARRLLEPDWFMDLAFYQGRQWLIFAGDRLQQPNLMGNRVTETENRIAGVVRTELAKMTKNRPVFTVTPNTGDEGDANAAELAERVMRFMWKHLKMHELDLKALEWSRICGAGFLKCYWDGSIGDPQDVLVGPDGKILEDGQGRAIRGPQAKALAGQLDGARTKRIAQGDVRIEVRSPFQMFIDPICDSFTEAEWVIEESIKSVDYVQRRYGVKLKADAPANPGLIETRMMGGTPGQSGGGLMGVRLKEYWAKPCEKYSNGVKITYAQGQVLDRDNKPFDPMPYVMLSGIPVPGRLMPMSVVSLLRGPQTALNKVKSQMAENRNRIGNPTLLASKQAVQDKEEFLERASQTGGAYFYDDLGTPNPLPKYLEAPPLPDYVTTEPEWLRGAIEDISGQHEVTNANVPPGITAASAITLLQEADDTRLGLAVQDHEEQLGRLGQKILRLVSNFYTDQRMIRIVGDDEAWDIFDFKGADLKGNTHVEVQAGSAFAGSKAEKQAQLTDTLRMLAQMGHQFDQKQLAQYLRDQGMGNTDRLIAEFAVSEGSAKRENAKMVATGQPLPLNDYDEDQIHLDVHQDLQRQPRYEQFPDQIKHAISAHTALHQQKLEQQQQQELQNQLALQGQVPPMLTQAAYQDQQQLANLQGLQQLQQGQQQQQQDGQQQAQQQGMDQASAEQQQRQAAEQHQQMMQHKDMLHQQAMQHAQEAHESKQRLDAQRAQAQMQAQAQQSRQQGKAAPNGR